MTSRKQRHKNRKSTYKLVDDAWDALETGHEALAERLAARAVEQGAMNPRVWCDQGRILERLGRGEAAERAYRNAVGLAPSYAEALACLARLLVHDGRLDEARALRERLIVLGAEEAAAFADLGLQEAEPPASPGDPAGSDDESPDEAHAAHIDWRAVADELTARGGVILPALLNAEERRSLTDLWSDPARFEHEVTLDDERGAVRYRFLARPIPPVVHALRAEIYARTVPIVNHWNELLGVPDRYPTGLADFLARCRRQGQTRTTPILLRYAAGGFNGFHRDVHGEIAFPVQLAITLSPEDSPSGSGDLLLLDERPGRRRVRAFTTRAGDGVLFCSRARLVRIAGLYGLQPVRHAVNEVKTTERFAVGIPFHDYA